MFVGRSRDTIRDQILAFWSAQYAALTPPLRLLIAPGSDAYILAASLAVQLEGLEAQAEQTARDILPERASAEALARHAYVDGVPRLPGTVARYSATVTNASDGTKTIPIGTLLVATDGTRYTVDDGSVTISGGTGTITVVAVSPGTSSNRNTGDTLTFNVGVVGIDTTATIAASPSPVLGTDEESSEAWAQRIVSYRQERPGSFNRSHVRALAEAFQGTVIAIAYVYPLLAPPTPSYPGFGVPETPGTVTVVAVGPAQGDSVINTRLVPTDNVSLRTSGAQLTRIEDYFNGLRDITGVLSPDAVQIRPAALPPENFSIEAASTTAENVVFAVSTVGGFPWTGSVAIGSATSTTIVAAGDHTDINGLDALVLVDAATTANTRGGYRRYTLPTGVYDGVNTTWTFGESFPDTPSGFLYPAPAEWEDIRDAVFAYFDGLAPGDTDPPSRWPPEGQGTRATLYRSALTSAVMHAVPDVLAANVTTPASDVTPPQKTVVILGRLRIVAL